MLHTLAICVCTILVGSGWAFAATGTITGTVTEARTGEPVKGASVALEQTQRGAVTDEQGYFILTHVTAGIYRVRVSHVGFGLVRRTVRVTEADTVNVDIVLSMQEVEIDEGIIVYSPVIDQSRTTPQTTIKQDDLEILPLRSLESALVVSPSMYKGFVRGGRQYETRTIIEGIDMTDQYYATATDQVAVTPYLAYHAIMRQAQATTAALISPGLLSVHETNLYAGTASTNYASATGGIISYNLQSPTSAWTAKARISLSQSHLDHIGPRIYHDDSIYARERAELLSKQTAADSAKANLYTFTPGKYSYGERPTVDAEVALGTSFPDGSMFLATRYFNSYGRLPNEFIRRMNAAMKLNYRLTDEISVTGVALLEDRGRMLGWKNRDYSEDFRYFLEGVPTWDGLNVAGSVKVSHFLSPTMYYELQASVVRDLTRRGFSDDNNDGIIALDEDGGFLTFADPAQVKRYLAGNTGAEFGKFFTPGPRNESGSETTLGSATSWKLARPGIFYERFVNLVATVKGDFAMQASDNHFLKSGFQVRFHDLARTLRASYIGGVFPAFRNFVEEIWNVRPKEYGLYVEDRMEFEGLMLNIGFRFDLLDLAAGDYADYFAPFRDDTTVVNNVVTEVRRLPVRGGNARAKLFVSPRLGASHPIGEDAALYFSFSRQQQSQPFSRLYSNYNDFGNPSLPVVTRTNQDAIRSTNYDLGIQWAFAGNFGFDINAYYKDIENYSTIMFTVTPRSPWRLYNLSTNFGYADARGVELTLRSNPNKLLAWLHVGGRITYAYSYIKQSVYAGGNVTTFSTASDSQRYNGQLPFDDIRSFNTIERNVLGGNSTLTGGYDRTHRIAFHLAVTFPHEFSIASVGAFQSGFYYPLTFGDPRARELGVGPWNKRIDIRFQKGFDLAGIAQLAVYVDVMNAFNWTNVLTYNTSTLGQEAWEKQGDPTGGPKMFRVVTQDGSMVYDIPREVYFGLHLTF